MNLDSTFGFSRSAAESAEYAKKSPSGFSISNAYGCDRKGIHSNGESPACSGVPVFILSCLYFFVISVIFVANNNLNRGF